MGYQLTRTGASSLFIQTSAETAHWLARRLT